LINLKFQSPHSRILSSSLFSLLPSFNFPSHFPAPTNGVAIRIMGNEMGYLPLPGDKATESQSLQLHLPASLHQKEAHYVCYGPCGSKRVERRQGRGKKKRKIQIWKWCLALQTDRKFCLTDDGCSGRGVDAVIKQFIAPDVQLGDTRWTSILMCCTQDPPERRSTEREGNRQTEGEEK